jgi:diguanylate cyclase (GGDEF)-like protein
MADGSWMTQQLIRYLSDLTPAPDQRPSRTATLQVGAERAAESVDAEFAAVVWAGRLAVSTGFGSGNVHHSHLEPVLAGYSDRILTPGGSAHAAAVPVGDSGWLVVARTTDPFDKEEEQLLRALARILSLSLRSVDALAAERSLRRESERRARESLRDPLTGLPNRALFIDSLRLATSAARERAGSIAVLFMDLDGFKVVNDTLGHSTGDELLQAVAGRVARATRGSDCVARLGGDEFAVLVDNLSDREQAETVAMHLLSTFDDGFAVAGRNIHVSASIGISFGPEGYEDPTHMLRDADLAMYKAKSNHGADFRIFSSDMRQELVDRIELENELRSGIDSGELACVYQPVLELAGQRLRGVEALVRWRHPDHGLLAPAQFLPAAEDAGLMSRLDKWVMDEVCAQLSRWRSEFPVSGPLRMGVNLSDDQLAWDGLTGFVESLLDRHQIPAGQLMIEVSETAIFSVGSRADVSLANLGELGVLVSLDDFGTGYSSLSRLRRLPVAGMKIDRSLVSGVDRDHRLQAVFTSVANLARDLAIDLVAEGVETAEEDAFVRSTGCPNGQGYFYGRPMPAGRLEALFLAAQSGRIDVDSDGYLLIGSHQFPLDRETTPAFQPV